MNFKLWLEASEETRSWQDVSGHFHPISNYTHHSSVAQKIAPVEDYMRWMFKNKWMRITYVGKELMTQNPYHMPNHLQLGELIYLAQTNGFESVIYDNDEDTSILWSMKDRS